MEPPGPRASFSPSFLSVSLVSSPAYAFAVFLDTSPKVPTVCLHCAVQHVEGLLLLDMPTKAREREG